MKTFYDFSVKNNKGVEISMNEYRDKVLLIVNTASKCGFTSQYKALESLYKKYQDQGLVVLGFPCDQFAHQEPGSDDEIASFCELNFGVTFPLMQKIEVNGENTEPLFDFLKESTKGIWGKSIKWNFTKFLVNKQGKPVDRFGSFRNPKSLESRIVKLLK